MRPPSNRFLGALMLALALFVSGPVLAGEAEWNAHTDAGTAAYRAGDYRVATTRFEAALREAESFGASDPRLATALNNLAALYQTQGRYTEAESLYRRSLEIVVKTLGLDHMGAGKSLNNLALLYVKQGRYAEAEPLYRLSLAIYEKALGPEHPDVGLSLNNLATLYREQGRFDEAEPLLQRSLGIREKALGLDHPNVGTTLNDLALLYREQGRFAEAEPLYSRSLRIAEKTLGPEHPDVGTTLYGLAHLYLVQGRHAEAEPLLRRSLMIDEKALGPEHPDVGLSLNNLASLYEAQGRYANVEPLYRRSLAINEKALGPEHPQVATSLNNLAVHYGRQGRYAEAEPLLRRSLAIREKMLGPEHPSVATTLENLAWVYQAQGCPAGAVALTERSLGILEKALGPEHPEVATALGNLAWHYLVQGRSTDAELLYKRSLAIEEKTLGPEHPSVAKTLNILAWFYQAQSRFSDALIFERRATTIGRKRATVASGERSTHGLSEQRMQQPAFVRHVSLLNAVARDKPDEQLKSEAFEIAQLARANDTGQVVARMAARFAKGDDELAKLARARQDTLARLQFVDGELVKAVSKPPADRNVEREKALRDESAGLDKSLAELDATLDKRFPEYKTLTSPEPLKLADAQALLGANEALVTYLVGEKESYLWVLRRDQAQFLRLDIGKAELDKTVQQLRRQLDPSEGVLRPFALGQAHELYRRIFAPAEALLKGATHVMVVADGALQSLPFGVLVTDAPKGAPADYRNTAWLAKRYALSVLPSESSLRALRRFTKSVTGNQPFSGFGDPVLEGGSQTRGVNVAVLFSRGAVADVRAVKQLQRLPETADELYAMANSLGADKQTVHLQFAATETNVKQADLTHYRVLAFATHGLMAGDFKGLAEPALVLTPPETGTELDDGLLTASEVAQLKLNADWVILSACNTAAADGTPGAEGLSGLAKAFFYAGSRALLVSHWPVASAATVKLTTRMFREGADNPGIGKAEALRRSMLALMADDKAPQFAHPAFWAPFVVVGEGNADWSK